ncbi:chaplin [Streptomyces beijiangensis]|uniref:Chaplin n=1 Tax=Streptomyces beijiangensis TaxID=163361 RepID=A0A939FA08_9ACTN|nr:chaplin [Streptomyces beijiangensis]MBO0514424.1 chaplin [Streptomyces beijiangensis]
MQRIVKSAVMAGAGAAFLMGGAGMAAADGGAMAGGSAEHSPGVVSGNQLQVPVHIPVNFCGNTIDGIGALNPAFGNTCHNG